MRTLILTVDDNMGISFNKRMCSRDSKVNEQIQNISINRTLYDSPNPRLGEHIEIWIDSLKNNKDGVYYSCYEDPSLLMEYFDEVILFKWNRLYPSDVKFTSDLSGFTLDDVEEFVGTSHENITKERYIRK